MTLQLALDDRGAATAWVRSGNKVLVIILDDEADAASMTAPFLFDPAIGSAIAQVHANQVEVPPERRLDGVPVYGGRHANRELPPLAPGVTSHFSVKSRDESGSVSVRTRSFEWLLYLRGSFVLDPGFDRGDDLPELIVHPTFTDGEVRWTVTLRANGTTGTHELQPGERILYGTTSGGTRCLSISLPAHPRSTSVEPEPPALMDPPQGTADEPEGETP